MWVFAIRSTGDGEVQFDSGHGQLPQVQYLQLAACPFQKRFRPQEAGDCHHTTACYSCDLSPVRLRVFHVGDVKLVGLACMQALSPICYSLVNILVYLARLQRKIMRCWKHLFSPWVVLCICQDIQDYNRQEMSEDLLHVWRHPRTNGNLVLLL